MASGQRAPRRGSATSAAANLEALSQHALLFSLTNPPLYPDISWTVGAASGKFATDSSGGPSSPSSTAASPGEARPAVGTGVAVSPPTGASTAAEVPVSPKQAAEIVVPLQKKTPGATASILYAIKQQQRQREWMQQSSQYIRPSLVASVDGLVVERFRDRQKQRQLQQHSTGDGKASDRGSIDGPLLRLVVDEYGATSPSTGLSNGYKLAMNPLYVPEELVRLPPSRKRPRIDGAKVGKLKPPPTHHSSSFRDMERLEREQSASNKSADIVSSEKPVKTEDDDENEEVAEEEEEEAEVEDYVVDYYASDDDGGFGGNDDGDDEAYF
jgi:hypothetical protein